MNHDRKEAILGSVDSVPPVNVPEHDLDLILPHHGQGRIHCDVKDLLWQASSEECVLSVLGATGIHS